MHCMSWEFHDSIQSVANASAHCRSIILPPAHSACQYRRLTIPCATSFPTPAVRQHTGTCPVFTSFLQPMARRKHARTGHTHSLGARLTGGVEKVHSAGSAMDFLGTT